MTVWWKSFIFCLAVFWPAAVFAVERVALVIGMSDYTYIPDLKNTVNDAKRISQTLQDIGFDVTEALDAPLDDLLQIIDDFAFRSETADLALVYFAGHGVEVQGENFLVPVDANVKSNLDIQRQSVSLKQLLTAVDRARKLRIVILDSCRNNPFGGALMSTTAESTELTDSATRGGLEVWPRPRPTGARWWPLRRGTGRWPWMAKATTAPLPWLWRIRLPFRG